MTLNAADSPLYILGQRRQENNPSLRVDLRLSVCVVFGCALEDVTLPRVLGMFSLLKALCLIHCSLFIHYKPMVSIGAMSMVLSIVLYLSEAIYYRSTTLNFFIVFPSVLNGLTLIGLYSIVRKINKPPSECVEENVEMLMSKLKYQKNKKYICKKK
ncbi:hypothetical protein QTP88_004245 [Uroleucon formosanum]